MAGNSKTTKSTGTKSTGSKSTAKKSTTKKGSSSKTKKVEKQFGDSIYDEIFIIVLLLVSILVLVSLFTSVMGIFGQAVNTVLKGVFGAGSYMLPIVVILFCVWMIISRERRLVICKAIGIVLFVISIATFFHLITEGDIVKGQKFGAVVSNFYKNATGINGGVVGGVIAWGLKSAIGWGSYVVTFVAIIIAIMLGTGKSLFLMVGGLVDTLGDRRTVKEAKIKARAETIKVREVERQEKAEIAEEKRIVRMEKKANKKGLLNIILGGNEGHYSSGLAMDNDDYLEELDKDNIKTMEEYEVPEREPIDLSDINFDEEAPMIEVIGVADDFDANIPVFGINETDKDDVTINDDDILSDEGISITSADNTVLDKPEPLVGVVFAENAMEELAEVGPTGAVAPVVPLAPTPTPATAPISMVKKTDKSQGKAEEMEIEVPKEKVEYIFPPLDLLGEKEIVTGGETKTDMLANAKKLEETLKSFGVVAKVTQINKGPTVTRYELSPNQGVKVSKIVNLADDIALNLAATGIRIEAPIPGKAAVGIEVPNKETQSVYLRSVLESEAFQKFPSKLAFALGEDITGKAIVTDIAKMPHLLIAGATGSGKSVCINTLITSILYKADPEEVKLLLVDPKVVELSVYNGIPHLLIPVVTDPKKAAGALNWAVREMLGRYQSFAEHNVRDIKGYNGMKDEKGETDRMPQIVIVIDELADLMMAAPGEVEDAICRLAQMARAAGIHLIIATQRPSVDVITGVIKANIPSRLAFSVSSGIDSRTILDSVGAEKLLGKGDMLFYPVGMSKPVRIQGAFVTDKEVESIVDFVKGGKNHAYDQKMIDQITTVAKTAEAGEDSDEFFDQAVDLVVEKEKASVSMLQRQFRIGYNRAARIVEDMEKRGFIGSEDGSKPRKVLITQTQLNELRYPVSDDID